MIICKIRFTLDFGIISLIPLWVYLRVTKTNAVGHLFYSNTEIGKSNTSTIFKIMRECSSLHRILEHNSFPWKYLVFHPPPLLSIRQKIILNKVSYCFIFKKEKVEMFDAKNAYLTKFILFEVITRSTCLYHLE